MYFLHCAFNNKTIDSCRKQGWLMNKETCFYHFMNLNLNNYNFLRYLTSMRLTLCNLSLVRGSRIKRESGSCWVGAWLFMVHPFLISEGKGI